MNKPFYRESDLCCFALSNVVQSLALAGLLAGILRARHSDYKPDLNFNKAKSEQIDEQETLL